ncbi:EpsG family protein [Pseudoalteromonas arctica]|uniref:EpsG family protein n=1 Tax=Pseudoalteromonas arctica A 37-1-2 TaxID=1117313 RepID=A0A290S278_9GAMM|nr:EpsG family protein [Pseudoalteromonas arctica]ATC85300.1 hypothetical protein PARC_a0581 [Pseudoalteromonas arctica A 37-1-2]
MAPYFIVLFFVVVIAYFGNKYGSRGVEYICVGLILSVLTLFGGLRNYTVGTDTGTYLKHLGRMGSFDDVWKSTEIGYNFLMFLSKSLSDNFASLLLLIAAIVVLCYVLTIVRMTQRYETAIFLFITLGTYTFFFNGARQGIAAGICFLAIPWLLERKPKVYFTLIVLAFTFHHTALIAAPIYFLARPYIGRTQILTVIGGTVIMTLFLATFVRFATVYLGDQYSTYAVVTSGGGHLTVAFLVTQGCLLYMARSIAISPNGYYSRLLNIYLLGLIPVVAGVVSNVNPSGIIRLHLYFSTTAILLWPMVFLGLSKFKIRSLISYVFFIVCLLYFFMNTSTFSNLTPYQLNSTLFDW